MTPAQEAATRYEILEIRLVEALSDRYVPVRVTRGMARDLETALKAVLHNQKQSAGNINTGVSVFAVMEETP